MSLLAFQQIPPSSRGKVWFVGAGPGAADLITLRGVRILNQAQAVIYDDLSGTDLLSYCPLNCDLFPVGKRAGCHKATQEEINRLLVIHARAGKSVVRLKGGDPAVFGRLGEEILTLRQASIPFEIVPGVTAACSAAAAAQLSLTQREVSSAVLLATGHECRNGGDAPFSWEKSACPGVTLCVYMGTRSLPGLAARLLAAGHDPETPLLILSEVSQPGQQVRQGTLSMADKLADKAAGLPSLIIIGAVAAPHHFLELARSHHREESYA